jgi:hypothetical protein
MICASPSDGQPGVKIPGKRVAVTRRNSTLHYGGCFLIFILLAGIAYAGKPPNRPAPVVRIPVERLGYLAPGKLPAFYYHALVGVHFIDENHLLFTFNIKGLLRRDDKCPNSDSQRMVRTVVLDIPSGKVERQVDWELFDFDNYLWGLGNGEFLLRRCSKLDIVGATLDPQPFIQASGEIQALLFSPDRSVMVVEESSTETGKESAPPQILTSQIGHRPPPGVDVQFIRLHPLAVIARAQIPIAGAIPVVSQGILEALAGPHNQWTIDIQPFPGTQRNIVAIHSFCAPTLTAVSNDVFVATMCPKAHEMEHRAYNFQGGSMWTIPFSTDRWLPRFIVTKNGARFAIETLHLKRSHAALDPLTNEDVDAQVIDIYDTHTGILIGSFRTTPVYTGGENVDFSPDGLRMAVLHDGSIEIYTLNELAKHKQ